MSPLLQICIMLIITSKLRNKDMCTNSEVLLYLKKVTFSLSVISAIYTLSIQFLKFSSVPAGTLRIRIDADCFRRGSTEAKIRPASTKEQMGSATSQPYQSISREDTMTATLPRVSAIICRNTPEREWVIELSIYSSVYFVPDTYSPAVYI